MTADSMERPGPDEFAYFTMRVRWPQNAQSDGAIRGVIECLGVPEKHAFESGEELLRIVARHGERRANMGRGNAAHKPKDALQETGRVTEVSDEA